MGELKEEFADQEPSQLAELKVDADENQ